VEGARISPDAAGPGASGPAPVPAAPAAPRGRATGRRARVLLQRFGALGALALLLIAADLINNNFLTADSIRAQLQIFCLTTALIAVGQTFVILTGGIDLSVGSLLAVGSCLAGVMVSAGNPLVLVFLAPMALTTVLGTISGSIIAKARIQPIVVTLAMLIAARGLAQLITGGGGRGHTLDLSVGDFNSLATTQLGPLPVVGTIPISVVIVVLVYLLAALFLARTAPGRYVFAVGGNERAARLSGVSADRVRSRSTRPAGSWRGWRAFCLLPTTPRRTPSTTGYSSNCRRSPRSWWVAPPCWAASAAFGAPSWAA